MKILIFAGYFYPHKGGYEDYTLKLAQGLINKGYHVDILTTNTNNSPSFEVKDKMRIYRMDCWDSVGKKYPIIKVTRKNLEILNNIKNQKYDIVNTHTRFWITSYLGYRFAKKNKIPLIHVEHGSVHTQTDSLLVRIINQIVDHTFGKAIIKNAKVKIGVSDAAINFMEHLGKKGDIKISKGLELRRYNKIKLNPKIKLNLKSNEKVIIGVGRLIYGKGFQDLITAFSRLKDKNLKLVLVGDGDYKDKLIKLVKELKISEKVIFTGEKKEEEVISCLNLADIFVNPSYSEGLPTTVLEAGAVGLPVIATDVGGTKEIILNNKTGILIKPKDISALTDSISKLLSHKKFSETLANNLNNLVKKEYSYEEMINKFDGVYRSLR